MNEQVIIESKQSSLMKIISLILICMGILAFIVVWNAETSHGFYHDHLSDPGYVWGSMVPYFGAMTILPGIVLAAIFYFWTAKCSMTVTDKRVYGKAAFGKRVDLPLDSVSAIAVGMLQGIAVATSSGKIQFFGFENRDKLHKEISKLLVNRQGKEKNVTTIKQEIPQSNADELKKYKDLLDSGIITQEEFDAKKKQLLGL